jgi:acetyl/propionyl-CoA carboxylase alpha subunit
VASQLLAAAGRRLPYRQEDIQPRGWAVEARVYAEDPWNGFAARGGVVSRVRLPSGAWVRVDHALREGVQVSPRYDTLLAKIVAYGFDRGEAVARLDAALSETVVGGVETNLDLLRAIVRSDWFRSGSYDTWTLEQRLDELLGEAARLRGLAAAVASALPPAPRGVGSGDSAIGTGRGWASPTVGAWHGWPWQGGGCCW